MYDDPKEKYVNIESLKVEGEQRNRRSLFSKSLNWIQSGIFVPVLAGFLQTGVGLMLVGVSILGLLQPVWISAVFSVVGSISSMVGIYLIYHVISNQDTFNTLINKAIRRVIEAQN
ncbi:MAG: hypothetical protein WD381_03495 [Balneolaceae bacterium]